MLAGAGDPDEPLVLLALPLLALPLLALPLLALLLLALPAAAPLGCLLGSHMEADTKPVLSGRDGARQGRSSAEGPAVDLAC